MGASPVGTGIPPDVRGGRADAEPGVRERVLDPQGEREGVARLRVEHVLQDDPVRLLLGDRPGGPADETVDRVRGLRFGERQLVGASAEVVTPLLDAVGPGEKQLPPPRRAQLVGAVAVEELAPARGVCAEAGSDLHHDRALVTQLELDLLA